MLLLFWVILVNIRVVKPLVNFLDNIDFYLRSLAASALGKIGDLSAIEPLRKSLNDEYGIVIASASNAIKKIED